MESLHNYVLRRLQEEKGNWPKVAREAGVSYRTLKKIATRDTASPGIVNLEKIAEYFRIVAETRAAWPGMSGQEAPVSQPKSA